MEKIKDYISSLSVMLEDVFTETEKTVNECNNTLIITKPSTLQRKPSLDDSFHKLKESVAGMTTLFQFGDIIEQSFESFDVIFEEINNFNKPDDGLTEEYAERFSRLIGAVSTNTFSLIGTTLLQLKEKLESARKMLYLIKKEMLEHPENLDSLNRSISAIETNIAKIEDSARHAVLSTESVGLFCIEKIVSPKENTSNRLLADKLYEKFRVREHLKILNSIFPTTREYSETGSVEFF